MNDNKEVILNPSPGQYNFERDNLFKKTMSTYNAQKLTSSFKNPLNCKRIKVNLYDPFQKVDGNKELIPSPGQYNLEKETIAYRNLEKMTTGMFSSVFQKPQNLSPIKGA